MVPEGLNSDQKLQDDTPVPKSGEIVISPPNKLPPPPKLDDSFEIRLVTREIPVRVEYTAIRAVRSALQGKESALGLLRGTRSLEAVIIEEFDLLSSEAATDGLIDAKLTKLDQSVLGFFRTQANGWAEIQPHDRLIARQSFKDNNALFLLVQNPSHRPWSAELYDLAGDGQFLTKDGAHEFYFDEYLLKSGYSASVPSEYVEPEEEIEEPVGRAVGGRWLVVAALAIIVLVGYGVTRWDVMKNDMQTLAHARAQAPSILELTVHRSGGDLAISWNREAPALEQSVSSSIVVSDGQVTRTFTLTREQLMAGQALYTPLSYSPVSGDFGIRLEVDQSARSQSESVLVAASKDSLLNTAGSEYAGKLRSASGAVVASPDVLPANATLPPPATVTPTPVKQPVQIPSLSTLTPFTTAPTVPVAIVREFPKLAPAAQQMLSSLTWEGKMLLSVHVAVDANGNVTSASVLPAGANLDQAVQDAALEAARQWKYKPGTLDGKPVASESTITFTFQ